MAFDATFIWNIIITLIIMPFAWAFNKMFAEVKRLQILLNKTREEYASKEDLVNKYFKDHDKPKNLILFFFKIIFKNIIKNFIKVFRYFVNGFIDN